MKLPDLVLPQKYIDDMGRPLENDLLALFKLLEEDTLRLLDRAKDEGWTPEEFEREIEALIMGDTRPTQVQKAAKPIGTISERKDGRYKKYGLGDWRKETNSEGSSTSAYEKLKATQKTEEDIDDQKEKDLDEYEKATKQYEGIHTPPVKLRDAMRYYSMDGYQNMNNYLRTGEFYFGDKKEELEKIQACRDYINTFKLKEPTTLFRGCSIDPKLSNGDVFDCKGFSSFSSSNVMADRFINKKIKEFCLFEFVADKGDPVAPINGNSAFQGKGSQMEYVLDTDKKLECIGSHVVDGVNVYQVRLKK